MGALESPRFLDTSFMPCPVVKTSSEIIQRLEKLRSAVTESRKTRLSGVNALMAQTLSLASLTPFETYDFTGLYSNLHHTDLVQKIDAMIDLAFFALIDPIFTTKVLVGRRARVPRALAGLFQDSILEEGTPLPPFSLPLALYLPRVISQAKYDPFNGVALVRSDFAYAGVTKGSTMTVSKLLLGL